MVRLAYHLNPPNLSDKRRLTIPALRQPMILGRAVADSDILKLEQALRTAAASPNLGKLVFREAGASNTQTMVIANSKGFADQRDFKQQFNEHFPTAVPAPGLEVIGCGYDIFGMYSEASSLKRRLFDIKKMGTLEQTTIGKSTFQHWPFVTLHGQFATRRQVVMGETSVSYTQKRSLSAGLQGSYLGFHAQTEADFRSSDTESRYHCFTNVLDITELYSLRLNASDKLRNYLLDEVRIAIDNEDGKWPADSLFDEFGLFFLTGAVLGGRISHRRMVDVFKFSSSANLQLLAEADYLSLVSGKVQLTRSTDYTLLQQQSYVRTETFGGDVTKGGGAIQDEASYQRWKDSIAANPQFVDFTLQTTKAPLTPIWTLAASPARRAELEKAAAAYEERLSAEFRNHHDVGASPRRSVDYLVKTYTGTTNGAGTDAGIWLRFSGRDRLGQVHESFRWKHDDGRDNHNKGAVDAIQLTHLDLGDLSEVRVMHDGGGDRGGWQLDKIEVICLDTGRRYVAPCNAFLSGTSSTFRFASPV